MEPLSLFVFEGGKVITKGVRFLAADGSEEVRDLADPNHCYLIRHPAGLLMWDSGLPDSIAALPGYTLGRGKFHFVVEKPIAEQLAEIGVQPEAVQWVAYSHLQIDHAGNAGLFTQAVALVQAKEYNMAFGRKAKAWGYQRKDYAGLARQPVRQLDGDYDVFGDGQVLILSAPGHTPGHQVLYVELPESGPVLLSGDLYYASQDPARGWMPSWNFDHAETRQTMQRLEQFAAERGARWVINHQPGDTGTGWVR